MKKLLAIITAFSMLSISLSGQESGQFVDRNDRLEYEPVFAPSEGLWNRYEKQYRREVCLNGRWFFQPVELPEGYIPGKGIAPELPLPEEQLWCDVKIKIPSPWNINAFANRNLAGPDHRNYPSYPKEWENVKMAWMKKMVKVPAEWAGERIRLHFEAVAGFAEIYVNRQRVGENHDFFLPFEIDITDLAAPGEEIEILVGVRSQKLFEDKATVGRRIVPAGSMWGTEINGIWQDVYLYSVPQINIRDVYVKPLVSQDKLVLEVEIENNTGKAARLEIDGNVRAWRNLAGKDINSAPVPAWELGGAVLEFEPAGVTVPANQTATCIIESHVGDAMECWTPERPNLYAALLALHCGRKTIDLEYERFGWREWTIRGADQCLNGKPYRLRGDSWHFMGIPQLTRRYAWAWYTAIKGMNGNAVRPHAQVYPRFYLDMADEMGICVLDETANWASDGGPKMDSEEFWKNSREHLTRFVLRDRNHASVFGWSISNENKPVILNVYKRPDLLPLQIKAWKEWRDIVMELDPTRPWISSDGEEDGTGILPVTVGHYGGFSGVYKWREIGKPWGVGEHGMAYFGTPQQVSAYNGERAYESQLGRMEGLANETYRLLSLQRSLGASYSTVFNMAWYALKPLPIGKKDLTTRPDIEKDGVYFKDYEEGRPGVQPERIGPYCTTFNPGYDPSLPLFDPWPMYDAMRAANAPQGPSWSPYAEIDKSAYESPAPLRNRHYDEVLFIGDESGQTYRDFKNQGVEFVSATRHPEKALIIADGTSAINAADCKSVKAALSGGADIWIWNLVPEALSSYQEILPYALEMDHLERSSFLPEHKSWMRGLNNSDFYFCELQKSDVAEYTLAGPLVEEGEVLLHACRTDWREWNQRPEMLKTAQVLRSENECTASTAVFVKCSYDGTDFYISTLSDFLNSEKGFHLLGGIVDNAGIPHQDVNAGDFEMLFVRDGNLRLPESAKDKLADAGNGRKVTFYLYSPRDLTDLLVEPDMPCVCMMANPKAVSCELNGKVMKDTSRDRNTVSYEEFPLSKGWNKIELTVRQDAGKFAVWFTCTGKPDYLSQLKMSYTDPDAR